MMKNLVVAVALFALISCGGTTNTDNLGNTANSPAPVGATPSASDDTGGGGAVGTVTGTVFAPNGADPIAGATVYVPLASSSKAVKNVAPHGKAVTDGSIICDDPPEEACVATCSGADGSFTLDVSSCGGSATIKIVKGSMAMVIELDCSDGTCAIPGASTTFPSSGEGAPKMAVVTGSWDYIQDVLAKLGFGSLDEDGHLDTTKPFQFDLIDGDGFKDDSETYGLDELLGGTVLMSQYDIIFINCGNDFEDLLVDSEVKTRIYDYVNNGGKLYVTDLSYDYIEQVFPNFMMYEWDPADPMTSGDWGDAESGTSGIEINAAVNDVTMENWLKNVKVIQHDAATPGNPDNDCDYSNEYTLRTGALNADDTIPIADFLGGWAHMQSVHAGVGALAPTIWISSGDGVLFDGLVNRPLTVSSPYGSSGGKIAYTSYHTAESCSSPYFWPQERVLQYLIFETF